MVCSSEAGLSSGPLCGPDAAGVCLAECVVDTDCGAVPGLLVCEDGQCRDEDAVGIEDDPDVDDGAGAAERDTEDVSDLASDADSEPVDTQPGVDADDAGRDTGTDETGGGFGDIIVDTSDEDLGEAGTTDTDEDVGEALVECEGGIVTSRGELERLAGCQRITSYLMIDGISLSSRDLAAIVETRDSLIINNISVAEDELSLDALRRVDGEFEVQGVVGASARFSASRLVSAAALKVAVLQSAVVDLSALTEVAGACSLGGFGINALLVPSLRSVGETLSLSDIASLTTLSLPSLTSVGSLELQELGDVETINAPLLTRGVAELKIQRSPSLTTLNFGSVVVFEGIEISGMNEWTDLSALADIEARSTLLYLIINENDRLETTAGTLLPFALADDALLSVLRNPAMSALGPLADIATIGLRARITVSENASLPQCAVSEWLLSASTEVAEATIDEVASDNDITASCP